jgi:hypothetical protein
MVYYDKAILGSASIFGMTTDLALEVIDYSTSPPSADTSRINLLFRDVGWPVPHDFHLSKI